MLYPDVGRTPPNFLHVRRGEVGMDLAVSPEGWPAVADCLALLERGASRKELRRFQRDETASELLAALQHARWLVPRAAPPPRSGSGLVYVGHNTFAFSSRRARVLVDPYLRPSSELDLPNYQPMQPGELGPIDAVVITHAHGDHFHLGSLLRLPRATRIFVPAVERESLFATDCAARLRQVGFTRVEPLHWNESRRVADVEVHALPFYGEQPTDGPGVYPGLFNQGSTWLLRGPGLSAAFFADAGRDVRGDMAAVCREVRRSQGPVDILCCGIRGFRLEPIFFGYSTLDVFLANVPLRALTEPQQLMASPADALRYAELLGARWVVPCADGGAPWYWREGMGPRYPGFPGTPVEGASPLDENPDADPFPERLAEVRARRRKGPEVVILRPGDHARWTASAGPRVTRPLPFRWPF